MKNGRYIFTRVLQILSLAVANRSLPVEFFNFNLIIYCTTVSPLKKDVSLSTLRFTCKNTLLCKPCLHDIYLQPI